METLKPTHDTVRLEKQIVNLGAAFRKMADDDDFIELLKIIKQPGWTTPAELILVTGLAESLTDQLKVVQGMRNSLLRGSRQVGR